MIDIKLKSKILTNMTRKKRILIIFAAFVASTFFNFGGEVLAGTLNYSWTCTGGTLDNPNIAQPTFTAPFVPNDTNYTCTLTVTDDSTGLSGFDDMIVLVKDIVSGPDKPKGEEVWDHCSIQGLSIPIFEWNYSDPNDNPQSAFQLRVYGEDTLDTGELSCASTSCTSYHPPSEWINDNLEWGESYIWEVRVRNDQGAWSQWSDFESFTMPLHAYPWPDFIHEPPIPSIGEEVVFTDLSECYSFPGNVKYSCQESEEEDIRYRWDFNFIPSEGFTIDSTDKGNTITTYSAAGSYEVRLKIIDMTLSPLGSCTGAGDSPVG
jgi:hypothetical protein